MTNTVAIKITSDGRAFVVDQQANATAVDKVTDAVERFNKTAAVTAGGTKQLTLAQKEAALAAEDFMSKLVRQADEAGKTRAELLRVEAAIHQVSDAAEPYIRRIEEIAAGGEKAAASAGKLSLATSGVTRELGVMAGEIARGNWTRLEGSMTVLANRTGFAQAAITGLASAGVTGALAIGGLVLGVGALAVAAVLGERQQAALNKALLQTNDFAGLTQDSFISMGNAIAQSATVRIGAARDAVLELAKTGKVTGDAFQILAQDIALESELTGKSLERVAEDYSRMPDGVAKWAAQHNASMHFMTLAQFEYIDALEKSGRTQDAMVATGQLLNEHLTKQNQNLGYLSQTWKALGEIASKTWDAMLNVGRSETIDDKIAKLQAQIAYAEKALNGTYSQVFGGGNKVTQSQLTELRAQLEALAQDKAWQDIAAQSKAVGEAQDAAAIKAKQYLDQLRLQIDPNAKLAAQLQELHNAVDAYNVKADESNKITDVQLKKMEQLLTQRDVHIKQVKDHASAYAALSAEIDKFDAATEVQMVTGEKLTASQREWIDESARINKALQDGQISLVEWLAQMAHLQAVVDRRDFWERFQGALRDTTAYFDGVTKSIAAWEKEQQRQLDSLDKQIEKQKETNAQMGMTKSQIDAIKAARAEQEAQDEEAYATALRNAAATVQMTDEERAAYIRAANAADEFAQKKRSLSSLEQTGSVLQAGADGAKKLEQAYESSERSIENSIFNALSEGGKRGREQIEQDLKNWALHFALQIPVQMISQSGASILNPNGTSASGGLGNGLSIAGGLSSLSNYGTGTGVLGAFNAGYAGLAGYGYAGAGGALSMGGSVAAGTALATDATGATVLAGAAGETAATSGVLAGASTALAAIPVVGWIALAALAAYSIFGNKGGGPKTESAFGAIARPGVDSAGAQQIGDAIAASFKTAADAIGASNDTLQNQGVFVSQDPKGTAQTQLQIAGGSYLRSDLYGGNFENVGRDDKALTDAVTLASAQDVLKNLQDAATGKFADFLKPIDITTASLDAMTKALQVVTDVGNFDKAIAGLPFASVSSLSVDATEKLITFGGGLQTIAANMATYTQQFTTSEEQRSATVKGINAQLATVGLSLDGIDVSSDNARAQFRALVEGIDTSTDAGLKQVAMLYSVAGAFASVTTQLKSSQQLLDDLAKAGQDLDSARSAVVSFGQQLQDTFDNISGQINELRGQAQQALAQAVANVQSAQDGVSQAREQITQGYLAALDKENQVKAQITQAYLQAEDAEAAARQRVADAQKAAAQAMHAAGDSILATLRSLAGGTTGSGNIFDRYTAQRNQLLALAQQAKGGDANAASQLGQLAETFLGTSKQRNTATGFTADDIFVRQLLAQVLGVTGTTTAGRGSQSDVAAAQKALNDSIDKANALQQLALQSGADLTASNTDLAKQLADATIEVAKWSSAIATSGAGTSGVDAVTSALQAYTQASQALATAQVNLTAAQATASAVDADLYDKGKDLVAQYVGLQGQLGTASTALATFSATVSGFDLTTTVVDPLTQLVANLTAAQNTQSAALNAIGATTYGQQITQAYTSLLGRTPETAGLIYYFNQMAAGETIQEVIANIQNSPEYRSKHGLPAFADGTLFVPNDGPAYLHRGEAVVPKKFNPAAFNNAGAANDPSLVSELRAMRYESKAVLQAIAVSNSRMEGYMLRALAPERDSFATREVTA